MISRRTSETGAAEGDPVLATGDAAPLTAAVATFEMAQRNRVATGELLRAVLQGRAAGGVTRPSTSLDAASVLREIRCGRGYGPVPLLGELYQGESALERECLREMERLVATHPAWPWMERVRGVGPTLAARLLARLRIERASSPSSFWRFCGLATVEGACYRCADCGAEVTVPRVRTIPRRHATASGRQCAGALIDTRRPVRVAMRLPQRGERRTFDVTARTLCHLIGTSFLRRGGRYREMYNRHRARGEVQHTTRSRMHHHLSAMRATEKLFLAHLWLVWAEAVGRPTRMPFGVAHRGRAGVLVSAHEMID